MTRELTWNGSTEKKNKKFSSRNEAQIKIVYLTGKCRPPAQDATFINETEPHKVQNFHNQPQGS